MDLIASNWAKSLAQSNEIPFVGFITGPAFLVTSIAQIALNLLATVFMLFPSFCIENNHNWHCKNTLRLFYEGCLGLFVGAFIFLPFTSLCHLTN